MVVAFWVRVGAITLRRGPGLWTSPMATLVSNPAIPFTIPWGHGVGQAMTSELPFVPSLLPVKIPWGNLSLEIYVCNECIFPES